MASEKIKILGDVLEIQSNMAIRNFLVALKLFLNAKSSLSLWSKWQIGYRKWFLSTNLFLIKPFLIAELYCICKFVVVSYFYHCKAQHAHLGFEPYALDLGRVKRLKQIYHFCWFVIINKDLMLFSFKIQNNQFPFFSM